MENDEDSIDDVFSNIKISSRFATNEEQLEQYRKLPEAMRLKLENSMLHLQRKKKIELLVSKRKSNISYLKEFHQGEKFWMDSHFFSKEDLKKYTSTVSPSRTSSLLALGLGFAKIVSISSGTAFNEACSQLIEEFEYEFANSAVQGVKFVLSKNSPCKYPKLTMSDNSSRIAKTPSLYRFNNSISHTILQTHHFGIQMDYIEIFLTLLDLLLNVYENILHQDSYL